MGAPLDISDYARFARSGVGSAKAAASGAGKISGGDQSFLKVRARRRLRKKVFSSVGKRYEVYERAVKLLLQFATAGSGVRYFESCQIEENSRQLAAFQFEKRRPSRAEVVGFGGGIGNQTAHPRKRNCTASKKSPAAEQNSVAIDNLQTLVAQTRGEFFENRAANQTGQPELRQSYQRRSDGLEKSPERFARRCVAHRIRAAGRAALHFSRHQNRPQNLRAAGQIGRFYGSASARCARKSPRPPAQSVRGATLRSDTQALATSDLNKLNEKPQRVV